MTAAGFFVTGTDTGIGKTWVTGWLMAQLQGQGFTVNGMKPVASGCEQHEGRLQNSDALQLQAQSSLPRDYAEHNPYAFAAPIAPHFAAHRQGVHIEPETISGCYAAVADGVDLVLVEGAGGWSVPLADDLSWADVVRALDLGVILVVGMRLGCINHALLTARAIGADDCVLSGWVANQIDSEYEEFEVTFACLQGAVPAPLLAVVPHNDAARQGCSTGGLNLSIFCAASF